MGYVHIAIASETAKKTHNSNRLALMSWAMASLPLMQMLVSLEPKESTKEGKNKSAIAISSKSSSRTWKNGGLVGYLLSDEG